jgi:hypothetical protein
MVLIMTSRLAAQSSDTLVVYATPITITLDSVVNHDQATLKHKAYKLVSTDTPYVFDASIVVDNSVTFIGKLGTNGRPPCIQPDVLTTGTIPGHLFTFTKSGSVVRIENLYLLGISINNSVNWGDGFGITITGDNVKCYINNVVMEQWGQFGINYSGKWDSFWITNCKFRNFVNPGSDYTGEVFRNRNDIGRFPTDTLVMKYNTFIALNGYVAAPVTTGALNFWDFEHNTVVGVYKNPFFAMNATNWKCNNNIFYAAYAGGMGNGEFPWWDRIWTGGIGSVIDLDTLSKSNAADFGIDTSKANWITLAEAKRTIQVNNNIYFRPAAITNFIKAINDTVKVPDDTVHQVEWMNDLTKSMFNNHTTWPGLQATGNQTTDPGYGAGIAAMIGVPGTTVPAANGIGMMPWLLESRSNGDVATHVWGYQYSAPDYSSGNWKPTWPLPEQSSNDLKYSASLTAPDGLPYGDPFWFTGKVTTGIKSVNNTPHTYTLSQNYPNPFNPSTSINFSLQKASNVTLSIYNVLGQKVATVVNKFMEAGSYNYQFDASKLASGVYLYRIEAGNFVSAKKMILMK